MTVQLSAPPAPIGGLTRSVMLGFVVVAGLIGFLAIRPYQPWLLWLTGGLTALAVDGIVRGSPR